MPREIRYCTAGDGIRIAYSVEGEANLPPRVWVPGWVRHLGTDGQPRDALGITDIRPVRFVRLDKRGTGLSSRIVDAGAARPDVMIAVDADEVRNLDAPVPTNGEIHILPAIAGG